MICLRCGYCCKHSAVVVIHPDYVEDKIEIEKLPKSAFVHLSGDNTPCPHLTKIKHNDKEVYICRIHHYDWYKDTPCYNHGQIETYNSNCRIGEYHEKRTS